MLQDITYFYYYVIIPKIKTVDKEILADAQKIWDINTKTERFQGRFGIYPVAVGRKLAEDFYGLSDRINEVTNPTTLEEVYTAELKRRSLAEAVFLDHALSGRPYIFEDVINIYGIEPDDIQNLRPWLDKNRGPTLNAIERVFAEIEVREYELTLPLDRPGVRRQTEEYAQQRVSVYHRRLGRMFEQITGVGGFLRDITSVITIDPRSYFDLYTKTLAISIPAICYLTEDGLPQLRERELIRLFGHEGFGHGCNKIATEAAASSPFFLKIVSGATMASLESVAQFYERQIFEDLKASVETQKTLEIRHLFDDIYREEIDTQLINQYKARFFQYGITVLADRSLGNPQDPAVVAKKTEILESVALYPRSAQELVESYKQYFDSEGNLYPQVVAELRYTAQPTQKVLDALKARGFTYQDHRTKTDILLLQGYWTPIGLVQRAKVA